MAWRAMPKVRADNERHNAVNPMRQYSLFLAEYCKPLLRYMRNMQRSCRGGCRMRELGCGPSPHEPSARIPKRPPLVICGLEKCPLRYHIAIVHIHWPGIAGCSYVSRYITTTFRELYPRRHNTATSLPVRGWLARAQTTIVRCPQPTATPDNCTRPSSNVAGAM